MTNRKTSIWKNLTIIILGGAAVSTWMMGACDSGDGVQDGPAANGSPQRAEGSLELVSQVPAGYALVPGGLVIHKDCVYQVPDGAVTHPDQSVTLNGETIAQYGPCMHKKYRLARLAGSVKSVSGDDTRVVSALTGTGNGWVENSQAVTSSTMFNHLDVGYWVVPPNPVEYGATVYFKIALETSDETTAILQPVLEWGGDAFSPYAYWSFANWWRVNSGPSAGIFVSSFKTATAGDQMWASLDMTNQIGGNQYWTLTIKDVTTGGTTTSNAVVAVSPFTWASAGILEAYNLTTCSQFPSGSSGMTYFPQPHLYQGTAYYDRNLANPTWSVRGPNDYGDFNWTGPSCNFNQAASSAGTWLYY